MVEEIVAPTAAVQTARGQRRVIAKAALVIMLGNIASRLLGLVRETAIAGFFGGGNATDAFAAAASMPNAFYDSLIGGMISAALVPVFSNYGSDEDERELWTLASLVLNLAAIGLSIAVLILIVLADPLAGIVGKGYDAEKQQIVTVLLRLMMPSILFMGLSGVVTAYLYSRQRFVLPALCAATYNLSIIVAALLFRHQLGVSSLAVGGLVGAFLQVAIQIPAMRGFRYRRVLTLKHPGLRKIGQLYLPVFLGLIISNVIVTVDRNFASQTGEGGMAAMRFATQLIQMPLGLIAVALGLALLPTLSAYAHKESQFRLGERGEAQFTDGGVSSDFKETLGLGLRMVILLIVPAAAGLVVLREPVIRLLFQHGLFNPDATARTATAFLAYSPGLPAAAVDQLLIFAFYARKNTWTPALVGVAGAGVYLTVALLLLQPLGMPGLALANSAQWIAHMAVMLFLLHRVTGGLGSMKLGVTAGKAFAAAAVTGLTVLAVSSVMGGELSSAGFFALAVYVAILAGIGLLAYVASVYVLDVSEVRFLWRTLMAKRGR